MQDGFKTLSLSNRVVWLKEEDEADWGNECKSHWKMPFLIFKKISSVFPLLWMRKTGSEYLFIIVILIRHRIVGEIR